MKCAFCQTELTSNARMCKTCGHPVSLNPNLEDLYFSRLATNAPPEFVQLIRSSPYLAKERRTVTAVLFSIANVESFTQTIPEEERTQLLNHALDRFAKIIFEFEGTIAKLWENTVLAFFGAPISHEDDPFRAVYAAQAILDENKKISQQIIKSYGIPLELNLVINTGPVLIGDVKSNLKFDFQSLNHTLECLDSVIQNVVSRCEVMLFEDTYRYLKPFIECQKFDQIYCEETDQTISLWRLEKTNYANNNRQRLSIRNNTPFVGRQKELDQLMELSETVLAGLGRVGVIHGEPGIGKSRLLTEWKLRLRSLRQSSQILWIEAQGIAFGRDNAYHLLKTLVRNLCQISETTTYQQFLSQMTGLLGKTPDAETEIRLIYIAHLLDIPIADEEEKRIHQLNALELRTQYQNAIRQCLRNIALEQPLIIILDDLHWADPSSVEILVELLPLSSSLPLLFCLVARPDRESNGWRLVKFSQEKFGPRLTQIELDKFDETQSETFIKSLIGIQEMPEQIRRMVLEKSEGNPLFIEELVDMLVNEGVLTKMNDQWLVASKFDTLKIPDSLQGLLSARIDRLSPEARTTLRIASVIGRTFAERVLLMVVKNQVPDLELMEQLSTLESIGMIKVAQVNPELVYKFNHILLHDAAYHSIIEKDLAQLHLNVATALEALYPDQKERMAPELAQHFLLGKDAEKALKYLDLAGHVVMDSYAHAEAEIYFNQAIQLTDDPDMLAHLYTDLGEALAQQTKHRKAIPVWEKAIQYHNQLGNTDRMARVYAWMARSAWWGYDPQRSLEICLEGLKKLEGAEESPDIAYLIHETGRAFLFNNQPEKAKAYSEQALEIAKRLDAYDVQAEVLATIGILPTLKPEQAIAALEMAIKISEQNDLYGPASRAYINLAAVIDNMGKVSLARDYRKRAVELGNKGGGITDEMMVNQSIASASLWLADFPDAEMRIRQMRRVSRQSNAYLDQNTLNLLYLEGNLARLKGELPAAVDLFTDLIDRSRQIQDSEHILRGNQALAEVIVESYILNPEKESRASLDIALNIVIDHVQITQDNNAFDKIPLYCLISEIYAHKTDFDEAKKYLAMAQSEFQNQPSLHSRVRIQLCKARSAVLQHRYNRALEFLNDTIKLLDKMEARWWRARMWFEIGNVHLERREPEDIDQAQNFYRDALGEFKEMGVGFYPDLILDKLRELKHISRAQAIAHRNVNLELAEAGRIQNTFMPTQAPNIKGYEISGLRLSARETSGDFFDFINLEDGAYGVVIADVGDKGAGAALYMAMSRTLIRTYAAEYKLPPGEVIQQINRRILSDTPRGIFLTVIYGILKPENGSFTYINAGHNPPMLLRKVEDEVISADLMRTGPLVGIFEESTWEEKTVQLHPGEVLVLYTDGITEAQDESGAFYGTQRLIDTLETNFNLSAEAFRDAILKDLQAFVGSAPRLDDITLIVISRNCDKDE